jgi:hypothetical protein
MYSMNLRDRTLAGCRKKSGPLKGTGFNLYGKPGRFSGSNGSDALYQGMALQVAEEVAVVDRKRPSAAKAESVFNQLRTG